MRSKYERVSDQGLLTTDECESWTAELTDLTHQQVCEQMLAVEPAVFTSACYVSDVTTQRLANAGIVGALTGRIHEDLMRAVWIGYTLARRGGERFSKDLLDAAMPLSEQIDGPNSKETGNE